MKAGTNKRKLDVYLMVGALILLFAGVPAGIWAMNSFNGWIAPSYTYTQIENETAGDFYDGPILDEDGEFYYATVNDTTVTEETWVQDSNSEWDSITIAGTGDEMGLFINWNVTVDGLLNSKDFQLRIKTNQTKELSIGVYATKWDGITLTRVLAFSGHVGNESQTLYWNWTPSDLLSLKYNLAPAITDEVWMTILITGYDADNELETADVIEVQLATGGTGAVYSFTSWQILTFTATIVGIILILVAFGSTPYWNPLVPTRSGGSSSGTRRKSPKRRSYKRRR